MQDFGLCKNPYEMWNKKTLNGNMQLKEGN